MSDFIRREDAILAIVNEINSNAFLHHEELPDQEMVITTAKKVMSTVPAVEALLTGVDYRLDFYDVEYTAWTDDEGTEFMRTFRIERLNEEVHNEPNDRHLHILRTDTDGRS